MNKFLALMILAAMPLSASAHGPSPQKIEKTITINAAPAKVWGIVKDFAHPEVWRTSIVSTKVVNKNDENGTPGTYRNLTMKDGSTLEEHLQGADDADMKFKYEITNGVVPMKDYYSYIVVAAGPTAGQSTVTWTARFYRKYSLNPPIPPGQDDESAIKFVNTFVDADFAGLKKAAENSKH